MQNSGLRAGPNKVIPILLLGLYVILVLLWASQSDILLFTFYLEQPQLIFIHQWFGNLLLLCTASLLAWFYWQYLRLHTLAQQSADRFQSTFEHAAVGIAHLSSDGRFLRVNNRLACMLQYEVATLEGCTFHEITHPDDLADDLRKVEALLRGEIEVYEIEKRYRRRDGQYFWANLSVSYHREPNPAHCYFISVIENIDQKKQATLALEASMAQVQLLLDATGDAMIGLNGDSDITFVNQTALKLLKYQNIDQLIGMPIMTLIAKQKSALAVWRDFSKILQQPKSISGEADLFVNLDGEVLSCAYRAVPVPLAQDGTVLVISWQNIRERKQQQLKQQAQTYLLHRLLDDAALPELLLELVNFIEQQFPAMHCSILLADLTENTLHVAAAPSLPDEYNQLVEGLPIRYGNGSCGTAAATGEPVIVTDVYTNMLWAEYQQLIEPFDWLQAVWSTPFFDSNRQLLGTFAIYVNEQRSPSAEEHDLIQFTTSLAAFLVERSDAKSRFDLLSKAVEQSPLAVVICNKAGRVEYCNQRFDTLTGQQSTDILGKPLQLIFPTELRSELEQAMQQVFAGESKNSRQDQLTRPDGSRYWQDSCLFGIVDSDQQVSHLLLELEDISVQKQVEQQWMDSELRFRTLLDNTPEISVQGYEADGSTFYWNKASEQLYGYSKEEALGQPLLDLIIPAAMRDDVATAMQSMVQTGVPIPSGELLLQRKDGSMVPVYSGHAVVNLPGRPPQIFCMDIELTERKKQEAGLRLAEAVFNSSREGILITDTDKKIISSNPAISTLFGYSAEELLGQNPSILKSDFHNQEFYRQLWRDLTTQHHWQGEVYCKRKDEQVVPLQLSISAVFNAQQQVAHYAAVFTDISRLKATEAEMMFLSEHDELTHLPNRHLFLQQVDLAIKSASRDQKQFAVLVVDLDHFKDINESYGHSLGDELLTKVAHRLRHKLRETDLIARMGGDEFALVLNNIEQPQDAAVVANKLIQLMIEPWQLSDQIEVTLGASVGISLYPEHGENTTILLQGADAALSKAKAAGRNTFMFYTDSYTKAARDRLTIEAQLRKALKLGHLRVFYQPQIEIYSGRIIGAEALVRWFDPEQGMISPLRFIPVAEACGLINAVGEFVLTETCRQGQQWLEMGLPRLTLAVNVSPAQFKRFDMRQQVLDVLAATGFPAHSLELELTESALMEQQETVIQTLNDLRGIGIRLAIDDFGTGYSSLAYLKRFPLDVLKIDKKFIDDIPQSKDDMAIATAIIGIAHTLGFKVLAEGVENVQQLEFLKAQHCDQFQGYLVSPPIPADKFQLMLEQQQQLQQSHLVF